MTLKKENSSFLRYPHSSYNKCINKRNRYYVCINMLKYLKAVFKPFIIFIYSVLYKNYINNLQEGKYLKASAYIFKNYEKK